MKKTYMAPLMEVVRTEAEEMICQSIISIKESPITGAEDGFIKADKDDASSIFEDLW